MFDYFGAWFRSENSQATLLWGADRNLKRTSVETLQSTNSRRHIVCIGAFGKVFPIGMHGSMVRANDLSQEARETNC